VDQHRPGAGGAQAVQGGRTALNPGRGLHVVDEGLAELGARHFPGARQQAGQVVGGDAVGEGAGQALVDQLGRFVPAEIFQQHSA
jgi:hypothetical protein